MRPGATFAFREQVNTTIRQRRDLIYLNQITNYPNYYGPAQVLPCLSVCPDCM